MIVLIDNYDETQIVNKLVELAYGFDSWNHMVKETIINIIEHMGNEETAEDHEKLVNCIYDLEGEAGYEVTAILEEYGFDLQEEF